MNNNNGQPLAKIDLVIGQIIKTQNRIVAVPERLTYWENGRPQESGDVCIRLEEKLGKEHEGDEILPYTQSDFDWVISTISTRGLVCFLPNQYDGCGILSIRINKVNQRSVNATPIEWVEFPNWKLQYEDSNLKVEDIKAKYGNQELIWHNKEINNG